VYRSYQLDPSATTQAQSDVYDMLSEKYGMSRAEAQAITQRLTDDAAKEGLIFHFDQMIRANTLDAHRLALWADAQGKRKEVTERLFKAHFTDSLDIGAHNVLVQLAVECGLDAKEAGDFLGSASLVEDVQSEHRAGLNLGIRGVPFFVFDRKFAVSGAQSLGVFHQAIDKAWAARDANAMG
jgi:predicted DsbA family dithiol-disulfide isomerase